MSVDETRNVTDEPGRLEILRALHGAQTWSTTLANGASARLAVGLDGQDDCCVFRLDGSQDLVVGSDYVRGPKFRLYELGLLDEYDLGWYLAAANLSDVAAMGAQPIGLLSVVRYPPTMTDDSFQAVLTGIRDSCNNSGVLSVGGDIGSAERLILSAAAFGIAPPGASLLRTGASVGDVVCVTGPTGLAGSALKYFNSQHFAATNLSDLENRLLAPWKRPHARVAEGLLLGRSGFASACVDTSDGLKGALEALAERGDVGFVIDESKVPALPDVAMVSKMIGVSALELAFGDSVDFQLLFTVAPDNLAALTDSFEAAGLLMAPIGVANSSGEICIRGDDGEERPVPGKPWRHASEIVPSV